MRQLLNSETSVYSEFGTNLTGRLTYDDVFSGAYNGETFIETG
jgi:hypothetical protein